MKPKFRYEEDGNEDEAIERLKNKLNIFEERKSKYNNAYNQVKEIIESCAKIIDIDK